MEPCINGHTTGRYKTGSNRGKCKQCVSNKSKRFIFKRRDERFGATPPAKCEACGDPPTSRGLVRDHDHATGAPRGWICTTCNVTLGQAGDNPERLRGLAGYLEQRPGWLL